MRHEMSRRELERICYTRPENLVLDEMARPLGLKTCVFEDPIIEGDEVVGRKAFIVLYDPIHFRFLANGNTVIYGVKVGALIEEAVEKIKDFIEQLIEEQSWSQACLYDPHFELNWCPDNTTTIEESFGPITDIEVFEEQSSSCDGGWCHVNDHGEITACIFDGWKIKDEYNHHLDMKDFCSSYMELSCAGHRIFYAELVQVLPTLLTECIHEENISQWAYAGKWDFRKAKVHAAQERMFDGRYRYMVLKPNFIPNEDCYCRDEDKIYEAIFDEEPSAEDEHMIIDMMIETVKGMN